MAVAADWSRGGRESARSVPWIPAISGIEVARVALCATGRRPWRWPLRATPLHRVISVSTTSTCRSWSKSRGRPRWKATARHQPLHRLDRPPRLMNITTLPSTPDAANSSSKNAGVGMRQSMAAKTMEKLLSSSTSPACARSAPVSRLCGRPEPTRKWQLLAAHQRVQTVDGRDPGG